MSYKVKLQSFEGPFDLLVYLIENAQMSIYDIEISSITSQYLDYIKAMKEMDITVSTEVIVLASSLIEIKSKMILPRVSNTGEEIPEDDPRRELVERLVEYKKYKKAAEILRLYEEAASDVFQKPQEDILLYRGAKGRCWPVPPHRRPWGRWHTSPATSPCQRGAPFRPHPEKSCFPHCGVWSGKVSAYSNP